MTARQLVILLTTTFTLLLVGSAQADVMLEWQMRVPAIRETTSWCVGLERLRDTNGQVTRVYRCDSIRVVCHVGPPLHISVGQCFGYFDLIITPQGYDLIKRKYRKTPSDRRCSVVMTYQRHRGKTKRLNIPAGLKCRKKP